MYPSDNQPQPQHEYPVDYLNQIAPHGSRRGSDRKLLIVIGAAIAAILIFIVLAVASSMHVNNVDRLTRLAVRMQTLQQIADKSQSNIHDSGLRSTNSSLSIFLTNAERDVLSQIDAAGGNSKKLDKSIVDDEKASGDKLQAELDDARLNAVFDRNYARDMSYQLDTVAALIREINSRTDRSSLKSFLSQTYDNLAPISQQLEAFNKANDS